MSETGLRTPEDEIEELPEMTAESKPLEVDFEADFKTFFEERKKEEERLARDVVGEKERIAAEKKAEKDAEEAGIAEEKRKEQEAKDARKAERVRRHTEALAAKKEAADKKQKELDKTGALWGPAIGLGLGALPLAGGWGVKKAGQAASGFLTGIERWADAKLNKHPVLRKVVGVALGPIAVVYGIGFWTGLWTAPLTGFGSHKLLNVEAQKSWAEQEAEDAGKKTASGGGGGRKK